MSNFLLGVCLPKVITKAFDLIIGILVKTYGWFTFLSPMIKCENFVGKVVRIAF